MKPKRVKKISDIKEVDTLKNGDIKRISMINSFIKEFRNLKKSLKEIQDLRDYINTMNITENK